MKKIFTLITAALLATGLWAADWSALNYSGGTELPEGYTYYGSSAGTPNKEVFSVIDLTVGDNTFKVFDVTAGGSGAYNKRAIEFTLTQKAKVTIKLYTGNNGRTFNMYNHSSTVVESLTLAAKNTEYTFEYEFTTPTAETPQTYSFSGSGSKVYIASILFEDGCTDPGNALTLAASKTTEVYAGDVITFSTTGGNGGTITLAGADAEVIADSAWTATAGKHTFTASQEKNGNYCAQESEVVIEVLEKSPVTAVTVDGPTAGYVGQTLTYEATAANASAYEWYLNDEKQGSDSAKFAFVAAVGNYTVVCKARNMFNAENEWIASEAKVVTVTKPCGELIKVAQNGQKAGIVTDGAFTGTADVNLSSKDSETSVYEDQTGRKLNTDGTFLGIKDMSGTLLAGDTAIVFVTTASANLMLYSDKGTTKIGEMIGGVQQGENKIVLNKNATGKNAIYLYRVGTSTDTNGGANMNPFVASISVKRSCEASNDATIKEVYVVIGENKMNFKQEADTFSFDIPFNVGDMTQTNVYFELNSPLATADKESPILFAIPEPGQKTETVITVTAEDGAAKSYTIRGKRLANQRTDATLKSLSVTGYTITPAFDPAVFEYSITKKYGAPNPGSDLVLFEAADGAHGVRSTVDDKIFITVTAEDNTTQLVYKIVILEAEKTYAQSINIEQLVLDNGVKYDIKSALAAANIEYSNIDALDSLNDDKENRNYPYLGLKLKKTDATLSCWLKAGSTIRVRFGNVGANFQIAVNDQVMDTTKALANLTVESAKVLEYYTKDEDALVKIICNSTSTLVIKQIMIDEPIAAVTLPEQTKFEVACSASEGGSVKVNGKDKGYFAQGDSVILTVTPNKGYDVEKVTVENEVLLAVEGVYSFVMPAKDVVVNATFKDTTSAPVVVTKYEVTCGTPENGSILVNGLAKDSVAAGDTVVLTVTPAEGYEINQVTVENEVLEAVEGVYSFVMPAKDVVVNATFKQKGDPQPITYTVTCAPAENGTVTVNGAASATFEAGETVTITVTPAEGYKINDVKINDVSINANAGVYTFTMPENDVTVTAEFVLDSEGFDNIETNAKAVKVIRNGQVVIIKNGKTMNILGAEMK